MTSPQEFATKAHEGQLRKGNGKPYITHCEAVAELTQEWCEFYEFGHVATAQMIAAAWLHDTVEDCDVGIGDIINEFGIKVAILVLGLTSPSKFVCPNAPRDMRKKIDCQHMALQPLIVQVIKACDIIHNASEIDDTGPCPAARWRSEKREMLGQMKQLCSLARALWDTAAKALQ